MSVDLTEDVAVLRATITELQRQLTAAESRNRDYEAVLAGIYKCGVLYGTQTFVIRLCNEQLDTSGALLGRVCALAGA